MAAAAAGVAGLWMAAVAGCGRALVAGKDGLSMDGGML